MKYLAALLLIFGFGLSGFGQTIKSLGYNTTNGQVVANTGTNNLTFGNEVIFNTVSISSANIGGLVLAGGIFNYNGDDQFQLFSNETEFILPINFNNSNVAATTRANLGFSTNLNTLWTATNASNARSAIGLGEMNEPTFYNLSVTETLGTNQQITFGGDGIGFPDEDSKKNYRTSLGFSTNLNTLWTASNASNARSAVELGNTNSVSFGEISINNGKINWGGGSPNGLRFFLGTNEAFRIIDDGIHAAIADGKFRGSLDGSVNLGSGQAITFKIASQGIIFEDANAKNITLTNLGLGGGITTNRTFVSYNGTNYTTNTVTISNGIITGWTQ